jgi:DNA-directed RNA polymerase specialized sigma24 family protein
MATDSADQVKITELLSSAVVEDPPDSPGPATADPATAESDTAESDPTEPVPHEAAEPPEPVPHEPAERSEAARRSAMHAFDLLYVRHAGPVGQQCYLLCGDRAIAERAVAHGFRTAWDRWPEVAVDRDPGGWVRAAAYEYALSPWHRLRVSPRRPKVRDGTAENQQLLDALLALPPSYRHSLVLHDGLGLGLPDTAAEAEATTAATAARIARAHESLAARLPRLGEAAPEERGELLGTLLEQLTETQPIRPLPAARARLHVERITRRRLAAALLLVALLLSAVAASLTLG